MPLSPLTSPPHTDSHRKLELRGQTICCGQFKFGSSVEDLATRSDEEASKLFCSQIGRLRSSAASPSLLNILLICMICNDLPNDIRLFTGGKQLFEALKESRWQTCL